MVIHTMLPFSHHIQHHVDVNHASSTREVLFIKPLCNLAVCISLVAYVQKLSYDKQLCILKLFSSALIINNFIALKVLFVVILSNKPILS